MRKSAGDKAETAIAKELEKHGLRVTRTKVSGAYWNDGDLIVDEFMIDSKLQEYRGSKLIKNLTLKVDEFTKVTDQARVYFKRPAMILKNGHGNTYVVLRIQDFAYLLLSKEHGNDNED